MKRILITGGAGLVGSTLAIAFKQHYQDIEVICLDNLSRRGSELNLPRLKKQGIQFVHGDVRNGEDLAHMGKVDWLIECSAEPSVHAGYGTSPAYLINTNLMGLINCLEFLRQNGGDLIFLSTSRVYPIQALRQLPLVQKKSRFILDIENTPMQNGVSAQGIGETFTLQGTRSLYGATKLCGELLIQEYASMYGLRAIINRCGVLTGPWQMGKVDQGFMALWVARHYFGGNLQYMGFEGEGLQVRDVLHVNDLFRLLTIQMAQDSAFDAIYNVGGGMENSVSLQELSGIVRNITGRTCQTGQDFTTKDADIPYFVTDITKIKQQTQWQPSISVMQIVEDIHIWLQEHSLILEPLFQA